MLFENKGAGYSLFVVVKEIKLLNDRGEKMVLEALDKIGEAEDRVTKMRQELKENLVSYEQEKAEIFKREQEESQAKVAKILRELEAQKEQQLQKEKVELLSEAKEQNKEFEEKYKKNKESIIDHVIERVKEIYGSQ